MREFLEDDPHITETYTEIAKCIQQNNVPVFRLMVLFISIVALILIWMQEDVPVCVCVKIWTPSALG
jgi:hypothetical protein